MMSASKLDFLIEVFNSRNNNPQIYDVLVKDKLNKLYDLLDKIKPLSDDEYKVLYFSTKKGSIQEYGNYEELKAFGDVSSYQEFVDNFNSDYPDEIYWYKMISTRYENYRMISINSKMII